ncbi:MAG: signal peptidase II [Planctomycetota bacterium]|nr:signal peptidase II [Planctomycetota bacterium]
MSALQTETESSIETRAASASTPTVMRPNAQAIVTRFVFVLALIAMDLWSKSAVFAWMEAAETSGTLVVDACGHGHLRYPIFDGWFTFMLSLNPGAAFGQLDSFPRLLIGGRVLAGLLLVWLLVKTPRGRPWLVAAFVLVLAGALGNLYDNLLRARDLELDHWYRERPFGPVRDFIDVYFGVWRYHFPTFNVADSCITVGAVVLLATSFRREKPPADAPVAQARGDA